jgi:hypothetical protein
MAIYRTGCNKVYYNLVLSHVIFHVYVLVSENVPVQSVVFIYARLYLKFKFLTIYYMLSDLYYESTDLFQNFCVPSYIFFLKWCNEKCGINDRTVFRKLRHLVCQAFS